MERIMAESKALTVRELLNGEGQQISPMDIDTSEIRELSNSIPKDGNIDLNQAEILATKFLRGADVCSELLAIGTNYASKMDTLKKKAYSEAALTKATAAGIKTDKSRAWYADADSDYCNACNRYSEAIAFVKWVDSKHESFIRAHYLCKKMLERGYAHEKADSWNGSLEETETGDVQTTRNAEIAEKEAAERDAAVTATEEAETVEEITSEPEGEKDWWEEEGMN